MGKRRIIFHIDVNSAFLSWTATKMVSEGQQDIRLVPSVVSGDPSDRRSIVTAASMPAKKLGIKTAQPISMALRICPNLIIVRGDWAWYKKCSDGFIEICHSYSPVLQQFSIDECFIDMSLRIGSRDPVNVATMLKDEIKAKLGFTVNVGIGENKLLAKMASDFEKPDKVHTLWTDEVETKMWPLGAGDLLWVGRKTRERLTAYGIHTIGDIANVNINTLIRLVGKKFALQLHENANGRDDSPVETEVRESKSISAERTFSKDITDPRELDRALFNVACIVAHRTRRADFRAACVSIFIKYKDFTVAQKQCSLSQPTDITALILNEGRRMLSEIWDGASPVRQVGLGVSKLTHENIVQMSLFEDPQIEYYREWDRRYDEEKAQNEDTRMLAYEKSSIARKQAAAAKKNIMPAKDNSAPSKQSEKAPEVLEFHYSDGESALKAAKSTVRSCKTLFLSSSLTTSGLPCFEIRQGDLLLERHIAGTE